MKTLLKEKIAPSVALGIILSLVLGILTFGLFAGQRFFCYEAEMEKKGYIFGTFGSEETCLISVDGLTEADMDNNWEGCKKAALASQQ